MTTPMKVATVAHAQSPERLDNAAAASGRVTNNASDTGGHCADGSFKQHVAAQYPALFSGIGKLRDYQAQIYIDPDVTPVAQKP